MLACCAGGKDHAWPSQDYLAEKASVSKRTIPRYLNELINIGLIEKARKWIKGQVRCVYRFLVNNLINQSSNHQGDKMSSSSSKILPNQPAKATNCPKRRDNLSPTLNKEETNKGKEIPPSPQKQADEVFRKKMEGDFFQITGSEEPYQNHEWLKIKDRLKDRLSEQELETWIEPLIFEMDGAVVLLRCPNNFFLTWVKKNFERLLSESFKVSGFSNWRLDIQTEDQLNAGRKKHEEKMAVKTTPQPESFETLSIEAQYQKFYASYPRGEKYSPGLNIFRQLTLSEQLPPLSELLRALKRQQNNNPAWQRDHVRYVPQIHNWLAEHRWLD